MGSSVSHLLLFPSFDFLLKKGEKGRPTIPFLLRLPPLPPPFSPIFLSPHPLFLQFIFYLITRFISFSFSLISIPNDEVVEILFPPITFPPFEAQTGRAWVFLMTLWKGIFRGTVDLCSKLIFSSYNFFRFTCLFIVAYCPLDVITSVFLSSCLFVASVLFSFFFSLFFLYFFFFFFCIVPLIVLSLFLFLLFSHFLNSFLIFKYLLIEEI